MDTQTLLAKPKPRVIAKITKIHNLIEVSTEAKKTTIALRKTFEKGVYQRKTQLSVLSRYKKRIDTIQNDEDKKYQKQTKKKPKKTKLPKFAGSFFAKGSADDPLKAISTLAAFNSIEKLLKGDLLGALSPGLVAAAALLGPGLLGMAGNALFNRGPKATRTYGGTLGYERAGKGRYTAKGEYQGVQKDIRERYARRFGQRAANKKFIKTPSGFELASVDGTKGGRIAKSFGKFGAAIIPGVGAIVGAADATLRAQAGDETGAAIAGTGAALDATAAGLAASGIGLPIAGLLSIASFALDLTNLTRDLLGHSAKEEDKNKNKDKLKKQTETQKALVNKEKSNLTFAKTLVSYEKALDKFEKFSLSFTSQSSFSDEGGGVKSPPPPGAAETYNGPISGDQFYPLPGGTLSTRSVGFAGGEYGAQRNYGGHSGQDIGGLPVGSPVVAWKTGKIRYSGSVEAGDTILTIDHGGGVQSVYKHVVPTVPSGTVVYGGQQIATLFAARAYAEHLHFEVWKNGSHKNPMSEIESSQKIPAPLSAEKAKEGKNKGGISVGPKTGYFEFLHGTELIIPMDNYHTKSGGDPLQNIPTDIINYITSKSKKYQMTMDSMPPEVIEVPIPMMPPQIQYVTSSSASLNIQSDADRNLLKMLYYSALG